MLIVVGMAIRHFTESRSWQAARAFKLGIYRLCDSGALARDDRLRGQLREAAASAVSHVAEGFGRFDPIDHARFLKMSRASLLECLNHLQDAVDRGYIADGVRDTQTRNAQTALKEIGGFLDYLQSPEAAENAKRVKSTRFQRRRKRTQNLEPEPGTGNSEPGTN
jgi:four helix bundle protein